MVTYTPSDTGAANYAGSKQSGPVLLRVPGQHAHAATHRTLVFAAIYALLAGLIALAGWITEVPRLADWIGSGIAQKANNAIAAIACASALLMLVRWPSSLRVPRFLAITAALIGGLTLIEHLTGIDFGIDTLLFDEPPGERATAAPGRMGPIASLSYLAIGLAIALCTYGPRCRSAAYRLALLILILNGIPALGYLYGADFLYALPHSTGIAFQTTTVLMALSIAVMASVPEYGITAMLRRNDGAGMLFRRMTLPVITLPIILGALRLYGEELGYYDAAFGTAALTFLLIVLLLTVTARGAQSVAEASSQLAEQSERLRTTLSSIGDGVIVTDTNGIVTMINPVAEALTGWSAAEALGQPLMVVFHILNEETRKEVRNPALRALQEGTLVGLANHTVLCAKDGSERPIDDCAAPIRLEDGEVIGSVLIFRDVAHKRLAERALRNSERRKDEFLATLAHELRNPLAPIRSSMHILKAAEADPALKERVLNVMERQVHQMVRLIDDLMEVTRITRGMIELRKEIVELASVIGNAVETATPALNSAGLQLILDLPEEPLLLEVDSVRLAQVFVNLLNNAAKYTPYGGKVRVTARREETFAVISVRDSGIGIPSEMLNRVFDLFTRVESARVHAHGGLGIGLALVKSLMQMHGGSVEARCEGPGRGSEFIVRVPLSISDRTRLSALRTRPDTTYVILSKRRILIVDDNRDVADSLTMLLRLQGAEILTVYDGPSVLETMRRFKPDTVLLDIGMPVMDGYTVAEDVRREPQFQNVVLIAMTGWGQPEDRHRSKGAGFDAHIVKPAHPPALLQLLDSLNPRRDLTEAG